MRLGRTVAELEDEMSSAELTEWMAFDRLDPIGPERSDWMAAQVAAAVANQWRGKGSRAARPSDYMPKFGRPGAAELSRKIAGAAAALGAE